MGALRGFIRGIPSIIGGIPTLGENSFRPDCPHCVDPEGNPDYDCDHRWDGDCGQPGCAGYDPGFDDDTHPVATGAGTKITDDGED